MKKILILLLFPVYLFGQDVRIPDEELVGEIPRSIEAYVAGNWGSEFLGVNALYQRIVTLAKRRVHVYVFDTAGDWDHPALARVEGPGAVFTGEPSPGTDKQGHSTHCAGIIGGYDPNTPLGIARPLIEKGLLRLYPYKVLTDGGSGSYAGIRDGVNSATNQAIAQIKAGDAVIFSLSLGGPGSSPDLEAALKRAYEAGVVIFAAAGNTGQNGVQNPGNSPWARAIAALQLNDDGTVSRASYSSYGPQVWGAYPGSKILSTYLNGTLANLSGTSMATPTAAGIAAIVASTTDWNNVKILSTMEKIATYMAIPAPASTPLPGEGRFGPDGNFQTLRNDPPRWIDDYRPWPMVVGKRNEFTGYGYVLVNSIMSEIDKPTPEPPKPDPPKPEPPKPSRELTVNIVTPVTVIWGTAGQTTPYKNLSFTMNVRFPTTLPAAVAAMWMEAEYKKHFTNVGYQLPAGSDERDALYWISYFFEMIMKMDGKPVEVLQIEQSGVSSRLVLQDPISGKPTLARAVKMGATKFTKIR